MLTVDSNNNYTKSTNDEGKKNKILLTIFLIGVAGFIILIFNRPHLTNPEVFDNISFPPTPHDLYNVSKVTFLSMLGSFIVYRVTFLFLIVCLYLSLYSLTSFCHTRTSFLVYHLTSFVWTYLWILPLLISNFFVYYSVPV